MGLTLVPPARGNGKRPPPITVSVPLSASSDRGISCSDSEIGGYVEWAERLTRRKLGARNALEAGDALPPFPTAVADALEGAGPELESERLIKEQIYKEDTAGGTKENRQAAGNRNATPAGQVGPPWTTPSSVHAALVAATSTPSYEGEGEAVPRGR